MLVKLLRNYVQNLLHSQESHLWSINFSKENKILYLSAAPVSLKPLLTIYAFAYDFDVSDDNDKCAQSKYCTTYKVNCVLCCTL
jgi:hypothetical protein